MSLKGLRAHQHFSFSVGRNPSAVNVLPLSHLFKIIFPIHKGRKRKCPKSLWSLEGTSFFLICLCRSAQLLMKYVSMLAAFKISLWPLRCFCWTGSFIKIHPFPELMNFNWPWPSDCWELWRPMMLMVSLQECHCTLTHLSALFNSYSSANFDSSGLT